MKKPKITYGADGWEIIVKNIWNHVKTLNTDKKLGVTRADVMIKKYDGSWKQVDSCLMHLSLIKIINILMEDYDKIIVFFTGEDVENGKIKNSDIVFEELTIEKPGRAPEEDYGGILESVISFTPSNTGFFISENDVEKIKHGFKLDFERGPGDTSEEKSALFIYRRHVVRLKINIRIGWTVHHGEYQSTGDKDE